MCDMFLFLHGVQFTGYADENTPFLVKGNIADDISALEEVGQKLLIRFSDNQMNLNTDRCDLLLNTVKKIFLNIGHFNFWNIGNSYSGKRLITRTTFDYKLKLNNHAQDLCKKAIRKSNAFSRIVPYRDISRRNIIMNDFFKLQCDYCPLFGCVEIVS